MPLKDTPWGSMKQARSAQHTPGIVPRPPRPTYLPPAPPKCSVSPLPSAVSTIGKSEATVVYDCNQVIKNGHATDNNNSITSPAISPMPDGGKVGGSPITNHDNHNTNHHNDTSEAITEESESEDLDIEDEDEEEEDYGKLLISYFSYLFNKKHFC